MIVEKEDDIAFLKNKKCDTALKLWNVIGFLKDAF